MALFDKTPAEPASRAAAGGLIENVTAYLDTRLALVRLDVQHAVRNALVGTLHGATLAVVGLLALIFVSIFAGLALNAALDSSYWGFGIVAGVYVLLALVFVFGVDKAAFTGMAEKMLRNTIYKSEIEEARKEAIQSESAS